VAVLVGPVVIQLLRLALKQLQLLQAAAVLAQLEQDFLAVLVELLLMELLILMDKAVVLVFMEMFLVVMGLKVVVLVALLCLEVELEG
jgi:hypothetical protein